MSRRVIVVGGGASGLTAAAAAAKHGAEVLLLERLPRVGKKLLLTGNGRCNLGHADADFSHYHGSLPQAEQILARFDTERFFSAMGLYTRTDTEGRMYPLSNTAASVLDALRFAADCAGVKTVCGMQLTGLKQQGRSWQLCCGEQFFSADAVILAAGGSAAPNCGTDGNLLPMLRNMGYTIHRPQPALCPVPTDPAQVKALKGLRVRAAATALLDGTALQTETGEVQFTENALSGICIFNLSRLAAQHGSRLQISLDLLPDSGLHETDTLLRDLLRLRGTLPASDLLTGLLPKRVAEAVLKRCGIRCSESAEAVSAEDICRLSKTLHSLCFPVKGTAAFSQAQVTAGGVAGDCVTKQLESKTHSGLFFCGELLDLDGDCGGYNLMWSWASGCIAGAAAAEEKP